MRRRTSTLLVAILLLGATPASAAGPTYLRQDQRPSPLGGSHLYQLSGTKTTDGGCSYPFPDLKVPAGVNRWEVRTVGIDPGSCRIEVEEGTPSDADLALPVPALTQSGPSRASNAGAVAAATSVASGYTSAWYEDAAGIHVTQDTTYISWAYNGSCVSSGSSSGGWSWDSLFTLVSYGGTNAYSGCSYFMGDTWSTMKTISLPCPWTKVWTYYYHIRAYGWRDGTFGASHSDNWAQNGCPLPLWAHWAYAKT